MKLEFALPDPTLSPNRKNGQSYHFSKPAKDKARELAKLVTYAEMQKIGGSRNPSELIITFIYPDRRNRDLDNSLASCKAHIDGMCQALMIDDGQLTTMILKKEYQKGISKMIFEI
jgi:Holliday junction resolvase RusA-like endonuclease